MLVAQFSPDQYIDADSLNTLAANTSAALGVALAGTLYPGLIGADSASLTVSGLSVIASLPAPFGVLFGTGVLANAHGVTNGADTQNYVTNLSGLVPAGSGSVTACLLASYQGIQQNPMAVVGPPPGHPDFNPNFMPFTAYGTQVDSFAVAASAGFPDNVTTFELCRFTLTSGIVTLPPPDLRFQVRFSGMRNVRAISSIASGATLVEAGRHYQIPVAEVYLLPPVSGSNDTCRVLSARGPGLTSVVSAGGDVIYGCYPTPAYPAGGLFLLQGQACELAGANGVWQVISGSPWISMYRQLLTSDLNLYCSPSGSDTVNTGLSPGSPFQTITKAYNYLQQNFDLAGQFVATINLAAGTYAGGVCQGGIVGQHSPSNVVIKGAGSALTTVAGVNADAILSYQGANISIQGVTLTATGSGSGQGVAIECSTFSECAVAGDVVFGTCTRSHMIAFGNSQISVNASYTVTGGAYSHMFAWVHGSVVVQPNVTVTLTGTPPFSIFAWATGDGVMTIQATYAGAATGQRFVADGSSSINTFGAGANYLPGSVAGLAQTAWSYQ